MALEPVSRWLKPRLAAAGWKRAVSHPLMEVYTAPGCQLDVTSAYDGHGVIIGEVFDQGSGRRLPETDRCGLASRTLDSAAAETWVRTRWGRYVIVRTTGEGATALRDPSGALECIAWRLGDLTLVASTAQAPVDCLLPVETIVDKVRLAEMVAAPGEFHHDLALTELHPVAAGGLITLGPAGVASRQIWTPGAVYRSRGERPSDDSVHESVTRTVRALVDGHAWVAELSGGLDSSVVAASLAPEQRGTVAEWVNHYTDEVEGDERPFAKAVAAALGVPLTEVWRKPFEMSARRLEATARAFRPAINDLDPGYNADIQERVVRSGARGVLTGQGGDAVFFQMATPLIGLDELAERGHRARASALVRIARWNRRSAWPHTWWRAWRASVADQKAWRHPWTDDLRGVPPAKALQINTLTYSQIFQQQALRSTAGDCLNVLLSQPIMELGLGLSSVDLTWGGRDRALIRRAFAAALPSKLIERRSKGDVGAFYGRTLSANLPFLRNYLIEGALAADGYLERAALAALLTEERILWQGDTGRMLSLALTEAWYRHWRSRLGSRPRPPSDVGRTIRSSGYTSAEDCRD